MLARSALILSSFLLVFLASSRAQVPPAQLDFCTGDAPDCVLACIQQARETHNRTLYENLLAEDFYYYRGQGQVFWGRKEELAAFDASVDDSLRIWTTEFRKGWVVGPGASKNSWIVSRVDMIITMDPKDDSQPVQNFAKQGMEFYVRRVENPVAHFEIFSVREPENAIIELDGEESR